MIVISKKDRSLTVLDSARTPVYRFDINIGKIEGDKIYRGDMRTPEGVYVVEMVQDPKMWPFDYKDGRGVQRDVYGPYFFRLHTPGHNGIGIHGERYPSYEIPGNISVDDNIIILGAKSDYEDMGLAITHGCIRLRNEDLKILRNYIKNGTVIVII